MRKLALLLAVLVPALARAQADPEEQARHLLEDGRTYWKEGKLKQALDSFETITRGFRSSAVMDDALLEIGRYRLEVDGDPVKAAEAFDRVAKEFPQSDGAPGAYYYLGALALGRAASAAELEDALAQLSRVERLYPRSDWVPRALAKISEVHRKAGRWPEAVEAARRVVLEHPTSDAAAEAQFQVGHVLALQGDFRPAMEEFQVVRNRYPRSDQARLALDRITGLYRLYGSGKPAFTLDTAYQPAAGDLVKDVEAILMTPARVLWIASNKVKSAVPVGGEIKQGGFPAEDLQSFSLTPDAELVVVSRLAVRIGAKDVRSLTVPGSKPGEVLPLDHLTSAVVTPGRSLLVADDKRKHIYRFDSRGQYAGTFPDAKEREVRRMVVDGEGAVYLLDSDAKQVQVFDEGGRPLRQIATRGTGWELKKPTDLAVDPQRNVYLADAEGSIFVFNPAGQLITTLSGADVRRPQAVALDPGGALLVHDGKAERIFRFR
jgi:outer membrane protein assembly factor BamD (BamD/ComL family)